MKKIFIALLIVLPLTVSTAYAYDDVPKNHWAESYIEKVSVNGIMQGMGNNKFGFGQLVKKSEFITMLCNMMGFNTEKSSGPWYMPYIEAAYENDVIDSININGDEYITREEMAEMIVRALGFTGIETGDSPFNDVNNPYITAAYDFGIIKGKGNNLFAPNNSATREESAVMMSNLYDKYSQKLNFVHGFYAISSYNQIDLAGSMDSVSFGWSRLEYNNEVVLNTTGENSNDWKIPDGADEAVEYFSKRNIPANLAVIMNTSQKGKDGENACQTILLNSQNRKRAIELIVNASSNFSGVTIDFEGMKGDELKEGLNLFLKELRNTLPENKVIYTAVHPVMSGEYYNGYDYKTICEFSDMVILMAHDYGALSMSEEERKSGFIATPVTPFNQVYTALKAITDEIEDKNKIALALSVASTTCWILDENGNVTNEYSLHPDIETVKNRLSQTDTVVEYSNKYRNPMAKYKDDNGNNVVLWYENGKSISDKIKLAKMFGINKVSVWRIGQISDEVWNSINM